jgi:2-oxoglutarate ferredoxin oxidoreductase subunit alpha
MADRQRVLMSGNDATGEGAIRARVKAYYGYPITPQNELPAYMAEHLPEAGGVFIQAESELAAINMVFGSAVAGARAMTSSSSPGISLKQEGISYMAGCELPGVIVNVQRGGPGLGNIAPSQGDYWQATRGGGHGDYRTPVLAPHSVQECFDLMPVAFDIADRYRTPVMILTDGRLGQMMEPVELRDFQPAADLPPKDWILDGCKGREPRRILSLLLIETELEALIKRLQARYAEITRNEVRFETPNTDGADLWLVAYGSCARICKEVVRRAKGEGLQIGLLRPITLWPFPAVPIRQAAERGVSFLVVEMSAGQMVEDVQLAAAGKARVEFYGRSGGIVPSATEVFARAREIVADRRGAETQGR